MNILLGISGSIAIYRSCDIVRILVQTEHHVTVVMTATAAKWISPIIFTAISGNHVYTNTMEEEMSHIYLKEKLDLFLVVPATANIIAKCALGIADDLLTTTMLAFEGEKWFAPAMNPTMWSNPIVQNNINSLKTYGCRIIEPIAGEAICGDIGMGKMAKNETIIQDIEALKHIKKKNS